MNFIETEKDKEPTGVTITMWKGLKRAIEKAAQDSQRSVSQYLKWLILKDLRDK